MAFFVTLYAISLIIENRKNNYTVRLLIKNRYTSFAFAAICFILAYFLNISFVDNSSSFVTSFEKKLHQKENVIKQELNSLTLFSANKTAVELFANTPVHYQKLMDEKGLALLMYENDSLKYWTDNTIAIPATLNEIPINWGVLRLKNGWFEVVKTPADFNNRVFVGLILIKNEYPYQNKYLVNDFHKSFNVLQNATFVIDTKNKNQIKNADGFYLFSIQLINDASFFGLKAAFALFFHLLGFVFLTIWVRQLTRLLEKKMGVNVALLIFVITVIVIRYAAIWFSIPKSFYNYELFNPTVYADANSLWLSSLGDLLINAILFVCLCLYTRKHLHLQPLLIKLTVKGKLFFSFFVLASFYWYTWIITSLFLNIIRNSNIPFSIDNLFSINEYTFTVILIEGLLLFSVFLIADKIINTLKQLSISLKYLAFVFVFVTVAYWLVLHLSGVLDLITVFWPSLLVLSVFVITQKRDTYPFLQTVFLVFVFSFLAMHIMVKHSGIKEMANRKVLAEKLAAEQDPFAEFLFEDIQKKIQADTVLIAFLPKNNIQASSFEKRIRQEYFSGFWEKYDFRITLFDSLCLPIIASANSSFDNNLYFDELIEKKGLPTSCEYLSYINNESGKISYIGKIPYQKAGKNSTLYIELDSKFISDEIGFPELLLDRTIGLSKEVSDYSYAKYKHLKLVNQYGKFPFNLSLAYFYKTNQLYTFVDIAGYNHLIYTPDSETTIVLSKKKQSLLEKATVFSYLFTFFSLILLLVLFFQQVYENKLFANFNFKFRIQLFIVSIVLIALVLFGTTTTYYIKQQVEAKNTENISEKIHSVLMEMKAKFVEEKQLSEEIVEYMTFMLKKYANVFVTDINIYDVKGNLFASSSSKLFNEGVLSKKMNPVAFYQISILEKSEYIQEEKVGQLKYLSAYIPFKNKDGKLLAYLNLPYFSKQSALENEISGFLVALINIYVFLFALSIVLAIIVSNKVTQPLKIIQDKLSSIKLGQKNEPIEWHENDEIGNLVKEYNRMIAELYKSTDLLAKSERESAWREMAKQVAHEIKNPLTPMKLSVQHLLRVWKNNDPDIESKLERFTQTIIEQIDTLSAIATEFSNFAQMPKAQIEKIDINQVLKTVLSLFQEHENINIVFNEEYSEDTCIMADKEQMIRVFNNLIKNAIQAIPEDRAGKIEVVLKKSDNYFLISIADNGTGIAEDVVSKIFTPNFTTKTTGMGLGLAMVKSIVESIGGKITFETALNKGTVFYVYLQCLAKE
ncbi:MAG: ATP-binding protein [Bacteroidia bacterium]